MKQNIDVCTEINASTVYTVLIILYSNSLSLWNKLLRFLVMSETKNKTDFVSFFY